MLHPELKDVLVHHLLPILSKNRLKKLKATCSYMYIIVNQYHAVKNHEFINFSNNIIEKFNLNYLFNKVNNAYVKEINDLSLTHVKQIRIDKCNTLENFYSFNNLTKLILSCVYDSSFNFKNIENLKELHLTTRITNLDKEKIYNKDNNSHYPLITHENLKLATFIITSDIPNITFDILCDNLEILKISSELRLDYVTNCLFEIKSNCISQLLTNSLESITNIENLHLLERIKIKPIPDGFETDVNNLSKINFSNLINLQRLIIINKFSNKLTTPINLSKNKKLKYIQVKYARVDFDLSENHELEKVCISKYSKVDNNVIKLNSNKIKYFNSQYPIDVYSINVETLEQLAFKPNNDYIDLSKFKKLNKLSVYETLNEIKGVYLNENIKNITEYGNVEFLNIPKTIEKISIYYTINYFNVGNFNKLTILDMCVKSSKEINFNELSELKICNLAIEQYQHDFNFQKNLKLKNLKINFKYHNRSEIYLPDALYQLEIKRYDNLLIIPSVEMLYLDYTDAVLNNFDKLTFLRIRNSKINNVNFRTKTVNTNCYINMDNFPNLTSLYIFLDGTECDINIQKNIKLKNIIIQSSYEYKYKIRKAKIIKYCLDLSKCEFNHTVIAHYDPEYVDVVGSKCVQHNKL